MAEKNKGMIEAARQHNQDLRDAGLNTAPTQEQSILGKLLVAFGIGGREKYVGEKKEYTCGEVKAELSALSYDSEYEEIGVKKTYLDPGMTRLKEQLEIAKNYCNDSNASAPSDFTVTREEGRDGRGGR